MSWLDDVVLPPYVDPEAWARFVEVRTAKGKRAPFTPGACKLALKVLERLHKDGHSCSDALDQSVLNGWSGIFPPKNVASVVPSQSRAAEATRAYLDRESERKEKDPNAAREAIERMNKAKREITLKLVTQEKAA